MGNEGSAASPGDLALAIWRRGGAARETFGSKARISARMRLDGFQEALGLSLVFGFYSNWGEDASFTLRRGRFRCLSRYTRLEQEVYGMNLPQKFFGEFEKRAIS